MKIKDRFKLITSLSLLLLVGIVFAFNSDLLRFKADEVILPGESQVENLTNNGADYPGSSSDNPQIPNYEKFELTFDINWYHNREFSNPAQKYDPIADETINPYWPYDPNPAANTQANIDSRGDGQEPVPSKKGISVDGIFTSPTGEEIIQPAFHFQDYERTVRLNQSAKPYDWIYPKGTPVWKVRFSPTKEGQWSYRIRVHDLTGQIEYMPGTNFIAISGQNRGFVQASPTDDRYFETSNGEYINFVGTENPAYYKDGVDIGSGTLSTQDEAYPFYSENGMNLMRVWWNASNNLSVFGMSGQGGFHNWFGDGGSGGNVELSDEARPGELFSVKIGSIDHKGIGTSMYAKPSTNYKFSAWVKTSGLGSGQVVLDAYNRVNANQGTIGNTITGDNDWTQISGNFATNPDQYEINSAVVKAINAPDTSEVYVTDISIKEDLGNEQYGPELIWRENFDPTKSNSQYESWKADYQVETAKKSNLYLKIALGEKKDKAFSMVQADGKVGAYDENNFYGWSTYAGRVYQQYFWRYVIARYGYATSIQSFELTNEGDPFNGPHRDATEAMAKYFNDNDPNKHISNTSFWHSFPSPQFWANSNYSNIKAADWHRNIGIRTGQEPQMVYYGWMYDTRTRLDSSVYHSASKSIHLSPPSDQSPDTYGRYGARSEQFALTPRHTYTLKWYIKGVDLQPKPGVNATPYIAIYVYDGHGTEIMPLQTILATGGQDLLQGNFDWTERSKQFTADQNGWMLVLNPMLDTMKGDVYFDDISLYDDTANEPVDLPNGDLESNRADYDSALWNYALGMNLGSKENRLVKKPIIDPNAALIGATIFTNPYKGKWNNFEDQRQQNDTEGVWYKKFLWSQINHFGVISLYYVNDLIFKNGYYKYAKAYQNFMSDISLSNGKYSDIKAVISDQNIRAWGQKEITDGKAQKAHLWIDNKNYIWKAIADHNMDLNDTAWVETSRYPIGTIAYSNGNIYKSIKDSEPPQGTPGDQANNYRNIGHSVGNTEWWQEITEAEFLSLVDMPSLNPPLPAPVSGTVTIPGMKENETFDLQWWNTSESDPAKQIVNTTKAVSDANGNLDIPVANLVSDIALKISVSSVAALEKPISDSLLHPITYKNSYKVTGTKTTSVTTVLVNDTEAILNNNNYEAVVSLELGENTITVVGKDGSGNQSEPVIIQLNRRKGGDANGDNNVNINDFGSLMANWGTGKSYLADFNEDNKVDMNDFSMMMSAWGK